MSCSLNPSLRIRRFVESNEIAKGLRIDILPGLKAGDSYRATQGQAPA